MEIKCPKCRYRYEVEMPQGMHSLSCVCPRCGTPFVHELPKEEDDTQESSAVFSPFEVNQKVSAHTEEISPGETKLQEISRKEAIKPSWTSKSVSPYDMASDFFKNKWASADSRNRGTLESWWKDGRHRLLVKIAGGLVIFLLALKGCQGDEISEEKLSEESTTVTEEPLDTLAAPLQKYDKSHAKPTPDWVFGTWQKKTNYGLIEIRLAGKWIRETLDEKTEHGVFFYSQGQINCIFNGCDTFVYRVDDARRRIDAGNGMWMKKISNK